MKARSLKKGITKIMSMMFLMFSVFFTKCSILKADEKFVIGISQFAEHPALDAVRQGFEDELKNQKVDTEIVYKNAQGDTGVAGIISQKFVADKVDLIFGIATISAQTAKQATSTIPVLFSAVTNPVHSQLVDSMENVGKNVTGTTDASPMDKQFTLFNKLDSSIKKIGIVYNTSESNSEIQIAQAKEIAKQLGLEIVTVGVNNINDIPQAINSLASKVDAFYAITDNIVASSAGLIAKLTTERKIPSIAGEEGPVKNGLLMTDGLSYYELGKQTGIMAKKILVDKISPKDIPVESLKNTTKIVNENTMKKLKLDKNNPAFEGAIFIK